MNSLVRTRLSTNLFSLIKNSKAMRKIISRNYAEEGKMDFTFSAANQVFYAKQHVKQVDVPSFSCSFGILPNHVPVLAVLKPGLVTVHEEDGSIRKIFVSSGTVTVNEDSSVQILAEEAHPLENFDLNAANQALSEAEKQLSSAQTEVEKAEAQIAVDAGQAIVAAISAA